jgi:hypothetical protein
MIKFTCNQCKKEFTTNYGLKKHMNKKTPCIMPDPDKKSRFTCTSCNHGFSSNQMLKHHISNTCQILKNKEKSDHKIEILTNTVNELKKELDSLKISKKVTTNTQNNTNCNNVVNNNITNNIQINSFANTEITAEHILNAFLKELSAAAEYSKLPEIEKKKKENAEKNNKLIASGLLEILDNVYSDPNNKNAYLHKKNIAKVYDNGGDWRIKSLEMVNRELLKIVIETVEKIKFNVSIPRSSLKYEVQGAQIKETLNTLPLVYWNNISEILKNSEFGLSVLLEANKSDIEKIQKEILENIEQDI